MAATVKFSPGVVHSGSGPGRVVWFKDHCFCITACKLNMYTHVNCPATDFFFCHFCRKLNSAASIFLSIVANLILRIRERHEIQCFWVKSHSCFSGSNYECDWRLWPLTKILSAKKKKPKKNSRSNLDSEVSQMSPNKIINSINARGFWADTRHNSQ